MDIQIIMLKDYCEAPYNPRKDLKPTDPEYQKLARSIDEFGFIEPIVVNKRSMHIISGHQRIKVLRERGILGVEAVIVDFSPEKEKACNIALNKIAGDWDEQKLSVLLEELARVPDFDVTITGFLNSDISHLLDQYGVQKDPDDFDFENVVDSIDKPITKRGDVIALGAHRIMCADAACESDLDILMQNETIDLVHIDPPYGCFYLAQNRPDLESRPKKSKRWEKLYKDDLNEKEYEQWIGSVLKNIRRFLKDGASAYIWNGHAKFYFVHQVLKELGFHVSTVITWAKPTFAISYGDFNQQTEFCLYSWLKNAPHKWYGPTNESNLWEIDRDKAADLIHPTQKSVEIPARAIRNSSTRGDVVFDGFLGSGSTLIAAESLGRCCHGMEIEPKYCDAIVKRYIAFAGVDKVSEELKTKYLKEGIHA
ncbi:MAG: DNA modification methylase [Candidatus Omnitrophota bacterium]|jgi:DNA modification methylase